jgi:penicillin-binding protein 1A
VPARVVRRLTTLLGRGFSLRRSFHQMNEPPTSTLPRTPIAPVDPEAQSGNGGPPPRYPRTRVKKLRLAFILFGLSCLAVVSTVFGMMMAVASDLPALESQAEYRKAKNSILVAADGRTEVAKLTGNLNRILLTEDEISPMIENAVIAIEDRRFYEHEGVDYKGIARALWQDLRRQKAVQGGSTITQQFVKNALSAQGNRSVFQKLREAALAYHMERRWSKQKIITQYLNSVYFGNGAYGIESAMRTYFGGGDDQEELEDLGLAEPQPENAAEVAAPEEAALLAGMIASPAMYDPVENPKRAKVRRDLVLKRMLEQQMISRAQYEDAIDEEVPDEDDVHPPSPDSDQPYFSSWLTQQLVDRYRPGVVFGGGLRIKTTLDPELQAAAEQAIAGRLGAIGPAASLVAIENRTGEVKAMVGGTDFDDTPFNLATNGHRQPGSAFKPFTLIAALQKGISPDAVYASQPKVFPVPGSKGEKFPVSNYEDQYYGSASLRTATAVSDNSVYAELGLQVGTERIARVAHEMGIRTPISTNPAMTLGGLEQGVTPLEMAYAYSTIANRGQKVSGTLAPDGRGPVAIERVEGAGVEDKNERKSERVFSQAIGETAHQILAGVVLSGTGEAAQIDEFAAGKTGTTENYGDAWFVGFNKELTVAVWVGYPDKLIPMETEYLGGPVAGGTYPAEIWQDLMSSWIEIRERRDAEDGKDDDEEDEGIPVDPGPSLPVAPAEEAAPSGSAPEAPEAGGGEPSQPAPQQPAPQQPAPTPAPAPAPAPAPPPSSGGGGGAAPG